MNDDITAVRGELLTRFATLERKRDILKAPELHTLLKSIASVPQEQRAERGAAINALRQELQAMVESSETVTKQLLPIDVTAPMDVNANVPTLIAATQGTQHPLTQEIQKISTIFNQMGYEVEDSREIDDQYHMFEALNFPKGHPARDDYDTFMTVETDADGDPLVAPAHTSTMQQRVLSARKQQLADGEAIAVVIPDRVFRNEDLDARHEHTFYQIEGVYVAQNVNVGNLIATLQTFLQTYYGKKLDVRFNPFYFPFTEPSFEFSLSCPFCEGENPTCKVCSGEGWIELIGCGMIHPNVLRAADIDPNTYTGFAFGCGIDRLVMMKYQIEDIRHLESAKLDFLEQF